MCLFIDTKIDILLWSTASGADCCAENADIDKDVRGDRVGGNRSRWLREKKQATETRQMVVLGPPHWW